ncbi:hypothetical protein BG004_000549, partial [Podila humilis]
MSSSNNAAPILLTTGSKSPSSAPLASKPNVSSLFIRKKPTIAHTGSRPLIRPYRKHGIDYDNPGKFDPPELKDTTNGVAIVMPGAVIADSSSHPAAPAVQQAPFVFDNHTDESKAVQEESKSVKRSAETSVSTTNDGLTILRIKRKRHEEPLDTLVVQQQFDKLAGKKQKKAADGLDGIEKEIEKVLAETDKPKESPAVFRLATTVNKEIFKDPTQSQQLRDTITHLAETPRPKSRLSEKQPSEIEKRMSLRRENLTNSLKGDAKTARYRVINQNRAGLSSSDIPPEVKSSVQVAAEAALDMFKMYDAVKEEEPKSKKQLEKEAEEAEIMCNFLPMVREYLSISDRVHDPLINPDGNESTSRPLSSMSHSSRKSDYDSDDEYVYDIYYRDINADHQQESKHRGIGSLLWFSDDEGNFMNEDESSDDDFEDSDSNAEDYYQNDYPEDEQSGDDLA